MIGSRQDKTYFCGIQIGLVVTPVAKGLIVRATRL